MFVRSMDDHARVLAQRPRQLAVAHIHRIDPRRAPLQQAIGEAAGRGADVRADPARRVHAERIQRGRQLQPAAADVGQALLDAQGASSATSWPGLSATRSPIHTWPARISRWAWVRLSARPRASTSSSRRTLRGFVCSWLRIIAEPDVPAANVTRKQPRLRNTELTKGVPCGIIAGRGVVVIMSEATQASNSRQGSAGSCACC